MDEIRISQLLKNFWVRQGNSALVHQFMMTKLTKMWLDMNSHSFRKNALTQSLNAVLFSQLLWVPSIYADDQVQALTPISLTAKLAEPSTQLIDIGGFGTDQLSKVPASISIITSEMIADQHAKVLTDVVKNDASVGDGYAAIGYYPNFVSRGFALDLASSYLLNGAVIRGEQNVALENKERVEILKGVSAIQSGMSTPGGVVNYVTKRPKDIKALTLSADQYGQYSLATDVGGFLGAEQQVGYRVNLVGEHIDSYVKHVDGQRYLAALALDWNVDERSKFEFDIENQHSEQRSVPGYQLLDGKVPQDVKWNRLLGYQSWGKPVTIDSLNTNLKYQYAVNSDWNLAVIGAYSRSKVDDYSTFAWGCYDAICQYQGLGNTFDKDGNYDIYDYQNPDDTFQTTQFKLKLNGLVQADWAVHHLDFELAHTQKSRDRFASVNKQVGVGNIYTDTEDFAPTTAQVGQSYQALKSKQTSLTALDRIEWTSQWSTLLGGKWLDLNEEAHNKKRVKIRDTDFQKFLPQLAVMYSPNDLTTLYASYAKGLSDGRSAAWFADNADDILAPMRSEQYEIGFKQNIHQFLFTAALFDLRQDNQYTKPTATGFSFVQEGKQHNIGLELGLNGELTDTLSMMSSLALTKARLEHVEAEAYEHHQAQNVPKLRATTHFKYRLPEVDGLSLLGGVQYSSSKYANKEATAQVKAYSVFDVGAIYQFKLNQTDANLKFNIDNLLNKKYWRDAGEFDGDNYLFLGAPRTATLSFTLNF